MCKGPGERNGVKKKKHQEVSIVAVNKDILLWGGVVSIRGPPILWPNDCSGTEFPQTVVSPSFLSPSFLLLTFPPLQEAPQLESFCQFTTPSSLTQKPASKYSKKGHIYAHLTTVLKR